MAGLSLYRRCDFVTFSEITNQVKRQQQIIDTLGKMLGQYPEVNDWVNELLVNHQRSSKVNRNLQIISTSSSIFNNYISWKLDINREVAKEFIKRVHQRLPSEHWMHHDLNVIYDERLFDNSPQLVILNDWRESLEIENYRVELRLRINLPPTDAHQQLNTNLMADNVYGIRVPFNWNGSFLKFSNNQANITAELLSAYDTKHDYIHYNGTIMEAKKCYRLLCVRETSMAWSKRLFRTKLPEYDQWIKRQRKCQFNINDNESYKQIIDSKKLQEKVKQLLNPTCRKIEKQFNIVFHEMLNYPAFQFGSCHLKFPRKDA